MDKMEKISEKLLDLGYRKQKFNKPPTDDFVNKKNDEDFFRRLSEELGDEEKATSFMNSYNKMILDDFIPEISFEGNGFEIGFFVTKGTVRVEAFGEKRAMENECKIIIQEVFPYKEMSINDFYTLMVEKNLGIGSIVGSSDN